MSQDPIPGMINVLERRANTTIVDVTTSVVTHLVFNTFVLGQRFCCTERWPWACTNLTRKSQLNSCDGRRLTVKARLNIIKTVVQQVHANYQLDLA